MYSTLRLLAVVTFFSALSANAQMQAAPWPDQAPEFQSAVFARAGVTVRDIDESLKFYRDVLGMTVIHERKAMYDPRLDDFSGLSSNQTIRLVILRPALSTDAKFHAGYIALSELSNADGERIDPKSTVVTSGSEPGSIMLQFMVEDAKLVHQQVVKLGYEIISSPDPDQPFGELLIRDPNGVRFWITDRYPRTILLR